MPCRKQIPFDPELVYEGSYTVESGKKAGEYLLGKGIQAVFAFNDMMAYGVYCRLKTAGVSMPDRISLVGYDDIFFSEILELPLTTVHQPVYEMGKEAAKQIIRLIKDKNCAKKCTVFKPTLIVRESTARVSGEPG